MENNKKLKTIGVLGGMGAAASADFYTRLVHLAQLEYKAEQDSDFPPTWIYNLPLTDFDETGFVNEESVKNQLVEGVKRLEAAGSHFIVIPCNTVHYFIEDMRAAVSIPIVSMIEVVADAVQGRGLARVGIVSSESTRNVALYQNALTARNVEVLSVTDAEQEVLNHIILNVIGGSQGGDDTRKLNEIILRFSREGAQGTVLGCTELPLAISQSHTEVPLFNSTELLARATLEEAYGLKS